MSLAKYEYFQNGNYIDEGNIPLIRTYICGNLTSWSPNRGYWEGQYNLLTKLQIVCSWRKQNGFRPLAKKGEAICNNKLIFLRMRNIKTVAAQKFEMGYLKGK